MRPWDLDRINSPHVKIWKHQHRLNIWINLRGLSTQDTAALVANSKMSKASLLQNTWMQFLLRHKRTWKKNMYTVTIQPLEICTATLLHRKLASPAFELSLRFTFSAFCSAQSSFLFPSPERKWPWHRTPSKKHTRTGHRGRLGWILRAKLKSSSEFRTSSAWSTGPAAATTWCVAAVQLGQSSWEFLKKNTSNWAN